MCSAMLAKHNEKAPEAKEATLPLLPAQRQAYVLALLTDQRWITVAELKSELRVSLATVRRDLDQLARDHRIVRVHGGAGSRQGIPTDLWQR
jgi:DeoR family transcriptional regulator, fructose operon transcriptional repressor